VRLGRKRWEEQRREIQQRDGEPKERPIAPSGRPYIEVRCHKCHKLLAYTERMHGDWVMLPPDRPPPPPEPGVLTLPNAPDVRLIPAGAGVVALWCRRCGEQRYTHSPIGGRNQNGKNT